MKRVCVRLGCRVKWIFVGRWVERVLAVEGVFAVERVLTVEGVLAVERVLTVEGVFVAKLAQLALILADDPFIARHLVLVPAGLSARQSALLHVDFLGGQGGKMSPDPLGHHEEILSASRRAGRLRVLSGFERTRVLARLARLGSCGARRFGRRILSSIGPERLSGSGKTAQCDQ